MISINPVSFSGRLARKTINNGKSREITKNDVFLSYSYPISKILTVKKRAMQLDELLFSDKDVKKLVDALPKDIEIEVYEDFVLGVDMNDKGQFSPLSPSLRVSQKSITKNTLNSKFDDLSLTVRYSKNGPIKKDITNWLTKLNFIFNKK